MDIGTLLKFLQDAKGAIEAFAAKAKHEAHVALRRVLKDDHAWHQANSAIDSLVDSYKEQLLKLLHLE